MAADRTLADALISVCRQALVEGAPAVELAGETFPVTFTKSKKLRVVRFKWQAYELDGIEQNPQTGSRWAALARQGKKVMQFSYSRRYFANVCEGKLLRYPAWKSLDLPE